MEDGNPAVSWGEKLKRGGVCVCVFMRGGSAISRGDNFFECRTCNGSWSRTCIRCDTESRGGCLWSPSQLPDDERYPHSSGFPCGEFPQEENTVTSHYPPHRHCDRLGTSRDQTFTKVKRASYHVTRTGGRKYKSKTFLKFDQMSWSFIRERISLLLFN